jgi:hypothetical protein
MDASIRRILPGLALTLILAPAALAQTPAPDSHWGAWRGCWRLVSEAGTVTATAQPQVCVTEVPGGARLITTVADKTVIEQIINTDGRSQAIDEAGCKGTQQAEWSRSGARLYSKASLSCSGDPAPRLVSGYALLLNDGTWLDIQAVEIGDRDTIRVRRYRHVDSATTATPVAGRAFTLDDVKEASSRVSLPALDAAIVETGARLALSAKALLELDAAGVPDRVIDLIVAVSYPDKFVVERQVRTDRGPLGSPFYDEVFMSGMFGLPMWSGGIGYYDAFWRPYYYSPFAYSYYGRFDPYYAGGPIYVTGVPPGGGGIDVSPRPSGRGRVVDGRGYTQVGPRATATADQAPGTSSGSSSSSGLAAPASASGSSSSSGSSNGSNSTSETGRTAVPR